MMYGGDFTDVKTAPERANGNAVDDDAFDDILPDTNIDRYAVY